MKHLLCSEGHSRWLAMSSTRCRQVMQLVLGCINHTLQEVRNYSQAVLVRLFCMIQEDLPALRESGLLGSLRDIQVKELQALIAKTRKRQDMELLLITKEGDYS